MVLASPFLGLSSPDVLEQLVDLRALNLTSRVHADGCVGTLPTLLLSCCVTGCSSTVVPSYRYVHPSPTLNYD